MNSNKTSKRGGARKGSGRKALNHVYLHIRIPKDIAEIIKQKAKEENITIGSWIVKNLKIYKNRVYHNTLYRLPSDYLSVITYELSVLYISNPAKPSMQVHTLSRVVVHNRIEKGNS